MEGGAIPRLWQGLAEVFAAKGHDVTILARGYKQQPSDEIIAGVKYVRRGGFLQSRHIVIDLLKDFANALRITPLLPAADILVVNDFWLPTVARWLRPDAGKIVININRYPKRQFFLYSGVARFAAASNRIADAVVEQCPCLAPKVRVFPNPTDTEIFSPPPLPRLRREDKTILYVGRIHPEKGLDVLIDAFALTVNEFRKLKLRVVGPVKEDQGGGGLDYFRALKSKAENLNIEFLEPIFDLAKLVEVYRAADLFCYPSLAERGESFGLAPLEAMATGLVPIVSDLKCFRDFIDEEQTGYYFDHRGRDAANNLSKAIRAAILSWDQTSRMSAEAVRRAAKFNYDRVGNLYLEDFEKLLSNQCRDSHTAIEAEIRAKPSGISAKTKLMS
jgi:glycosyltransferase involved in cell wall biosynthesis